MTTTTLPARPGRDALGEGVRSQTRADRGSGRAFRTDIQGLRAVAVLLVVLYHAGVPFLPGGYVGVDVFFVISGFLITAHLVGEVERTGRVSLAGFYARRIRRLLPPALLVVVATVVVAAVWGPVLQVTRTAQDALFAAFYAMNYHLAATGVDYQQAEAAPSPLQHFWSLAVEEQFYLFWPLVVLVVALVTKRASATARRLVLGGVVAAAVAVSLHASVTVSVTNPPLGYYSLQTRAWELGAGALVALAVPALTRLTRVLAASAGWVGLLLIVASAAAYDETTVFPGSAALVPVVGAALVVAGGVRAVPGSADRLLRQRGLQFLGAVSYGWYLWHWPALLLGPDLWGVEAGLAERLVLCGLALWLATLTHLLVERPAGRRSQRLRTWAAGALGMSVLVAGVAGAAVVTAPDVQGEGARVVAAAPESTAELQSVLTDALSAGPVPANLEPSLAHAPEDVPDTSIDGCHVELLVTDQPPCVYGDASAERTVLLFGDSHAEQWFSPLRAWAREHDWRLVSWTKVACPLADVSIENEQLGRTYSECAQWREERMAAIAELAPDLVVTSQADALVPWSFDDQEWAEGTERTLHSLADLGAPVVLLGDTPRPGDDAAACLAEHLDDSSRCTAPSDAALRGSGSTYGHLPGRRDAVRAALETTDVDLVDTQPWFCVGDACPTVVGPTLVYRDDSHMTQFYARTLTPVLGQVLDSALEARP